MSGLQGLWIIIAGIHAVHHATIGDHVPVHHAVTPGTTVDQDAARRCTAARRAVIMALQAVSSNEMERNVLVFRVTELTGQR